jgi:hypothetical protein
MMAEEEKGAKAKNDVIITDSALVISLTPDQQKQAQECLRKSGKISFSFKEISVTKLPQVLDNGVSID